MGTEAFVEQSVVLLVLAFTAGIGTAAVVAAVLPHARRLGRRIAAARQSVPSVEEPVIVPAVSVTVLPEPLLASAPAFELAGPPRSRREARTRR